MTVESLSQLKKIQSDLTAYAGNIPDKIYFRAGWITVFLFTSVVWFYLQADKIQLPSIWGDFVFLPIVVLFLHPLHDLLVYTETIKKKWSDATVISISMAMQFAAVLMTASTSACALSYVMARTNFPLIDSQLENIDKFLGFDWLAVRHFSLLPGIHFLLHTAYATILPQALFISLWFGWRQDKSRLYELFWILFLSAVAGIIFSRWFPAVGPAYALEQAGYVHISSIKSFPSYVDYMAVRAGINSPTMPDDFHGIITFPSFHTTAAIVYMYAFRGVKYLNVFFVVLNLLMLVSIPNMGNHYLIDMLAGAAVAVISILIVRLIKKRCFSSPHNHLMFFTQ